MGAHILLIEDNAALRSNYSLCLTLEGYQVQAAASLAQAFALWHKAGGSQGVDLVLLDLGLPDGSGVDFLSAVPLLDRTPVIVISARQSEQEKVRLFELGADAYLVKPFAVPVLLACVRSKLEARLQHGPASLIRYTFGEVSIDLQAKSVLRAGIPVTLTATEYRLLARLVHSAGKVVTENQLMADAMDAEHADRRDLLRIAMAQLRAKLEAAPLEPLWLHFVPGVGYQLAVASTTD